MIKKQNIPEKHAFIFLNYENDEKLIKLEKIIKKIKEEIPSGIPKIIEYEIFRPKYVKVISENYELFKMIDLFSQVDFLEEFTNN